MVMRMRSDCALVYVDITDFVIVPILHFTHATRLCNGHVAHVEIERVCIQFFFIVYA